MTTLRMRAHVAIKTRFPSFIFWICLAFVKNKCDKFKLYIDTLKYQMNGSNGTTSEDNPLRENLPHLQERFRDLKSAAKRCLLDKLLALFLA